MKIASSASLGVLVSLFYGSEDFMTQPNLSRQDRCDRFAWILMAIFLPLILWIKLLPALFAGLLVHELVQKIARRLPIPKRILSLRGAKAISLLILVVTIVAALSLGVLGVVSFFKSDTANVSLILQKMADVLESMRKSLPHWVSPYLPQGTEALQTEASKWFRDHAGSLGNWGTQMGYGLVYALIGMVIGAIISLSKHGHVQERPVLVQSLIQRANHLSRSFGQVVFAQVQISAINTTITSLYLLLILPWFGIELPLVKTMIAITFIAGLLPVLGNLISNTVIVSVSLSYSFPVALASLVYLVVIHKLEYFINARIIGGQIEAKAWEILIAMLIMEAIFGVSGVIAAPIFYAYLKRELSAKYLV